MIRFHHTKQKTDYLLHIQVRDGTLRLNISVFAAYYVLFSGPSGLLSCAFHYEIYFLVYFSLRRQNVDDAVSTRIRRNEVQWASVCLTLTGVLLFIGTFIFVINYCRDKSMTPSLLHNLGIGPSDGNEEGVSYKSPHLGKMIMALAVSSACFVRDYPSRPIKIPSEPTAAAPPQGRHQQWYRYEMVGQDMKSELPVELLAWESDQVSAPQDQRIRNLLYPPIAIPLHLGPNERNCTQRKKVVTWSEKANQRVSLCCFRSESPSSKGRAQPWTIRKESFLIPNNRRHGENKRIVWIKASFFLTINALISGIAWIPAVPEIVNMDVFLSSALPTYQLGKNKT
ncbi:hypothetical protein IW262DRAFT_1300902 [Armillaria fumosa]|nr:hypothetical protein IW262DRAFT_1300902 [Armillaria fumosa]